MAESEVTRRDMIGGIAAGLVAATASRDLVAEASAQSTAKTFLLVHGNFFGGWCWRRVADRLERKGHKVFTPTLPASASIRIY
jgi:hypothetical protein